MGNLICCAEARDDKDQNKESNAENMEPKLSRQESIIMSKKFNKDVIGLPVTFLQDKLLDQQILNQYEKDTNIQLNQQTIIKMYKTLSDSSSSKWRIVNSSDKNIKVRHMSHPEKAMTQKFPLVWSQIQVSEGFDIYDVMQAVLNLFKLDETSLENRGIQKIKEIKQLDESWYMSKILTTVIVPSVINNRCFDLKHVLVKESETSYYSYFSSLPEPEIVKRRRGGGQGHENESLDQDITPPTEVHDALLATRVFGLMKFESRQVIATRNGIGTELPKVTLNILEQVDYATNKGSIANEQVIRSMPKKYSQLKQSIEKQISTSQYEDN